MDSLRKYKSFREFIVFSINDIIAEHSDINNLQNLLNSHFNNVRQEIVTNCRAHTSIEDRVNYISKIKNELRDLRRIFIYTNDEILRKDELSKSDKVRKIFIRDIASILDNLNMFISHIGLVPQKVNFIRAEKQTNPSFRLIKSIKKDDIIEVCHKLKELQNLTIDSDTSEEQFYLCFSGKQVASKVKWHRKNVMHYFITELAYAHLMETPLNRIWEIAAKCFVDKKGGSFTAKDLGKIKPLEKESIKKRLDDIITPLKALRGQP